MGIMILFQLDLVRKFIKLDQYLIGYGIVKNFLKSETVPTKTRLFRYFLQYLCTEINVFSGYYPGQMPRLSTPTYQPYSNQPSQHSHYHGPMYNYYQGKATDSWSWSFSWS